MKKFNINDNVKVKLTEYGISIIKKQHEELKKQFPTLGEFKIEMDENGYITTQLWALMRNFGPYIGPGIPSPFENLDILISEENLNDVDLNQGKNL